MVCSHYDSIQIGGSDEGDTTLVVDLRVLVGRKGEVGREQNVGPGRVQVDGEVDDVALVYILRHVVLVQPSQPRHLEVAHDLAADLQRVGHAGRALELQLLDAKAEIVHGDRVRGLSDVDVKVEFLQRPRVGLRNALPGCGDIGPETKLNVSIALIR